MEKQKKDSGKRVVRVVTDGKPTAYVGYLTRTGLDLHLIITDMPCIDDDLPVVEVESLPN